MNNMKDKPKQLFSDFHRQHPCEELAVVLRYVELARIGLENAHDVIDDKLFDSSEWKDYT